MRVAFVSRLFVELFLRTLRGWVLIMRACGIVSFWRFVCIVLILLDVVGAMHLGYVLKLFIGEVSRQS